MTANERDPRVAVVQGCHSEGGDSILTAFYWEPLRAKLQDNYRKDSNYSATLM